jgi:hypothetical protein
MSCPAGLPRAAETQKVLNISNLISPPDVVYDSFSSTAVARIAHKVPTELKKESARPEAPMISPPVSPYAEPKDQASPALTASLPVKDPILYPRTDASPSPSRPAPLFPADLNTDFRNAAAQGADREVDTIIDKHIQAVGPSSDGKRPAREDYKLALYFKGDVFRRFRADPTGWLKREKALLAADRASHTTLPIHHRPDPKPQPKLIRSNVNRVQKTVKGKEPRVTKPQPRPIRTNAGAVRSTVRVSSTPEPRTRTVAPNREDKDFASLPDLCPPLDSLPNRPNILSVEWRSAKPLDLSKDPHIHLLHPEEVRLAASLRLDCATYLTSKRRIFERRLLCAQVGKEFRKTDAQQACNIDVNKASKLWSAYDGVNWLDIRWMAPYMR